MVCSREKLLEPNWTPVTVILSFSPKSTFCIECNNQYKSLNGKPTWITPTTILQLTKKSWLVSVVCSREKLLEPNWTPVTVILSFSPKSTFCIECKNQYKSLNGKPTWITPTTILQLTKKSWLVSVVCPREKLLEPNWPPVIVILSFSRKSTFCIVWKNQYKSLNGKPTWITPKTILKQTKKFWLVSVVCSDEKLLEPNWPPVTVILSFSRKSTFCIVWKNQYKSLNGKPTWITPKTILQLTKKSWLVSVVCSDEKLLEPNWPPVIVILSFSRKSTFCIECKNQYKSLNGKPTWITPKTILQLTKKSWLVSVVCSDEKLLEPNWPPVIVILSFSRKSTFCIECKNHYKSLNGKPT